MWLQFTKTKEQINKTRKKIFFHQINVGSNNNWCQNESFKNAKANIFSYQSHWWNAPLAGIFVSWFIIIIFLQWKLNCRTIMFFLNPSLCVCIAQRNGRESVRVSESGWVWPWRMMASSGEINIWTGFAVFHHL